MVIMDMENGDQVTKRGCLFPQDSIGGEGGNYPLDSRGGGVSNPNNPPLFTPLIVNICSMYYIVKQKQAKNIADFQK